MRASIGEDKTNIEPLDFHFIFAYTLGMPDDVNPPHPLVLAALIVGIRTARIASEKMQGMSTPQVMGEIAASIWLAHKLAERMRDRHPELFTPTKPV